MKSIKKSGENEVILKCKEGNKIKIIFKENDDYETEDNIMRNLLTSYEKRMKKESGYVF